MKKFLFAFVLLSFISCGKKEWTRDSALRQCSEDFRKRASANQYFSEMQITSICSCVADNVVAKYKSQAEMDKDQLGKEQIATECTMEVLKK